MPRYFRRYSGLHAHGLGTGSALLPVYVPPPPPPPGGVRQIVVRAVRMDGLTGTVRTSGPVHFAPGELQPAGVSGLTLWNASGAEVPCIFTDIGARHPDGSVLYVVLHDDVTYSATTDVPLFTVRTDRTSGTVDPAPGPSPRFSNAMNLTVSADGKSVHLSPFTYYRYDGDAPIRHPGGDVTWNTTPTITGVVDYAGTWWKITVDPQGVLRARLLINATTLANQRGDANGIDQNPAMPGIGEQAIGTFRVFVPNGSTWVVGTDSLVGNPAVDITLTSGTTWKAFNLLPDGILTATFACNDPAYLTKCYFPGHELPTEQEMNAAGSAYLAPHLAVRQGVEIEWQINAFYGVRDAGAGTTYSYPLELWMLYAKTGLFRYLLQAHGVGVEMDRYYALHGFSQGGGEADSDPSSHLVYFSLTNDKTNLAGWRQMLLINCEQGQLATTSTVISSGSTRRGMNAMYALAWFERLGLDSGNGFVLRPSDYGGTQWSGGAAYTNANGNLARWQRLINRYVNYMSPVTNGQRWLVQCDYATNFPQLGVGCFMTGKVLSVIVFGAYVFGQEPTGMFEMIRDAEENLWTGTGQVDGTSPFFPAGQTPGNEAFVYATPGGIRTDSPTPTGSGASTSIQNGFHLMPIGYLLKKTLDPKWRTRGDMLYKAMGGPNGLTSLQSSGGSNVGFNYKDNSEVDLHSGNWFKDRKTVITGYTGVFGSITLNQTSVTLLRIASEAVGTTLSVTGYFDRLGDPLDGTSATVSWASSNSAIIAVDANTGVVSRVTDGTATITCSATLGGVTKTATCTVTAKQYILYEQFAVDGNPGALWTYSVTGAAASQAVSGGTLRQTTQNVSHAEVTQAAAMNVTGAVVLVELAGIPNNISCNNELVLCDAAGVGIMCRVAGTSLAIFTTTTGLTTPVGTTAVGGGVSVTPGNGILWRLTHDAATNKIRVEYSNNNGTTWLTKDPGVTVTGFDPTTAKLRLYARVNAGGVGPFVSQWSRAEAY